MPEKNAGMSEHLHSDELASLAVDAAGVAKLLHVSLRHVNALNASGRLPKPIRLGRSVRWPVAELEAWISAGAPSREAWEQMRKGGQHDFIARSKFQERSTGDGHNSVVKLVPIATLRKEPDVKVIQLESDIKVVRGIRKRPNVS